MSLAEILHRLEGEERQKQALGARKEDTKVQENAELLARARKKNLASFDRFLEHTRLEALLGELIVIKRLRGVEVEQQELVEDASKISLHLIWPGEKRLSMATDNVLPGVQPGIWKIAVRWYAGNESGFGERFEIFGAKSELLKSYDEDLEPVLLEKAVARAYLNPLWRDAEIHLGGVMGG